MARTTQSAKKNSNNSTILLGSTAITGIRSVAVIAAGMIGLGANAAQAQVATDALPTGFSVNQGAGSVAYDLPNARLDVNQTSNNAVFDWSTFNIGTNAHTNFNQNSASSIAVNRVSDVNPSQILGNLTSNGQIVVLNQNGVFFGSGAVVDVAGLVASTGTIDTAAFALNGAINLSNINTGGTVENNGLISIKDGGLAAFVAPHLINNGIINANLGRVALAAGDKATVDLFGDGLVELALDDKISGAIIENSGTIAANGGTVALTTAAAQGVVDAVINMDGIIEATSVSTKGGKIILGGANTNVTVSGSVDASGATGGGDVSITGENVYVTDTGTVSVNAREGNGGYAYIYGDNYAIFNGTLNARGGMTSGNGGNAEISGGNAVGYAGFTDLSAAYGETGTLLIDPRHLTISSDVTDGVLLDILTGGNWNVNINDKALANTLASSNVNLWATETLSTGSDIDLSVGTIQTGTTYGGFFSGCFFGCPVYSDVITNNNLTVAAPEINILHDVTLGTGSFNMFDLAEGTSVLGFGLVNVPAGGIQVDEVNLDGTFFKRTSLGDAPYTSVADASQLDGTANTVNVISNNALINQGIQFVEAGGDVNVGAGTFNESVNVDRAVKIAGEGKTKTFITPTSNTQNGFTVDGAIDGDVIIQRMAISNARDGIQVKGTATGINNVTIGGINFKDNAYTGVRVDGDIANRVSILNSNFLNNGFGGGSAGEGDILFWLYNGDVVLRNLDIQNNSPIGTADYGIQIRGSDTFAQSGNITLENVKVSGNYRAAQIGIQRYTDLKSLNMTDVVLGGQTDAGTDSTGWGSLYFSDLGPTADINIGNTVFNATAGGYIDNDSTLNIDATGATFEGVTGATATLAENFAIEDKVKHALDDSAKGLVTWKTGNVFVTQDSGSIQRGVDASSVGGNVYVDDGTFNENVLVDKSVTITGTGTTATTILQGTGTGTGFEIAADDVSLNGMIVEDFTYGLEVHSGTVNNLSMDDILARDNTVGFKVATIAGIDGLTVTNSHFDNNAEGWTFAKGKNASTVTNVNVSDTSFSGNLRKGLYAEKLDNATFTDVMVDGSGVNGTYSSNAGIDINLKYGDYANISFDNLTIINSGVNGTGTGKSMTVNARNDGSYATDPASLTNLTITNSNVTASGDIGISVENNVDGAQITGTTVTGSNTGTGILSNLASNVTLDGNTVDGFYNGVLIEGGTNVNVIDNDISNFKKNGITFKGTDLAGTISGNTVKGMGATTTIAQNGIQVSYGATADITDNTISDISYTGANWSASDILIFDAGNGVTVVDNIINGTGADVGVNVVSSEQVQILRNTIDGAGMGVNVEGADGTYAALYAGWGVLGGSQKALVKKNTISNTTWGAIGIDGAYRATVSQNIIHDTGDNAIHFLNSDNGRMYGNHIGYTDRFSTSAGTDNIKGDGILIENSDNVDLRTNNITETTRSGIELTNSNNASIGRSGNGNIITNAGWDGIRVIGGDNVQVDSNSATNSQRAGIYMESATNSGVTNNTIDGTKQFRGISIQKGDNINVSGNTVSNTKLDGIISDKTSNLTVAGNTVRNTGDDGIEVTNSYNAQITGNKIDGTAGNGIYVANSGSADIQSNKINVNVWGADTDGNGIYVVDSDYVDVKHNKIDDTDENGIYVSSSDNAEIIGNTITDAGQNGIKVNPSDYVDIAHNEIHDARWDGILVDNGKYADIWNNHVHRVGYDGIDVNNNRGVEIWRNTVKDTGDNGIEVSGSRNALVSSNTIYNTDEDGINVDDSYDATVRYNDIDETDGNGITLTNSRYADIYGNEINKHERYANTRGHGIYVDDSYSVDVKHNDVDDTNKNGIYVKDSNNAEISNNEVTDAGENGIYLRNSDRAEINDNEIDDTDENGIKVSRSDRVDVNRNRISHTNDDGIDVENSDFIDIFGNRISHIGDDGIDVEDSRHAEIGYNRISDTRSDGIELDDSRNAVIKHNLIGFAGGDGIDADDSDNLIIFDNKIGFVRGNGIRVEDSDFVGIFGNDIALVGDDGINIDGGYGVGIVFNNINGIRDDGIRVDDNGLVFIGWNDVANTGDEGIQVSDAWNKGDTAVTIKRNAVENTGGNGIQLDNFSEAKILGNRVKDADENGIDVSNGGEVKIRNNKIRRSGENGIEISDLDFAKIKNNKINRSDEIGVFISGPSNGDVIISGNELNNNPVGMRFESGAIDLTGDTNVINGGNIGLQFDPFASSVPTFRSLSLAPFIAPVSNLSLVDNSFGTTEFNGQSDFYIRLENGALFAPGEPTILDATQVSFDGTVVGGGFIDPVLFNSIGDKLYDFLDEGNRGLIFYGFPIGGDISDILPDSAIGSLPGNTGASLTIRGLPLPTISGAALANLLANIAPAAGGDETPEDLNDIETAAGEETVGCWNDAFNSLGAGANGVSYNMSTDPLQQLNDAGGCGL